MKDNHNKDNVDIKIDLRDLFSILYARKIILFFITSAVSILAIVFSFNLPDIYETEALLAPNDSSSGFSRNMPTGGFANIAGINFGSYEGQNNSTQAIKKIVSLSFFENNVMPRIFLPNLMAVDYWDSKDNEVVYDQSLYLKKSDTWINSAYPENTNKKLPSAQESYRVFKKHITLTEDQTTGFVKLKVKHQSPYIAKKWADTLIQEINKFYRQKDKSESEKAIKYLNEKFSMTNLAEIKMVLAELIQNETQKLALIEVNESYIFEFIDPPAIVDQKSDPKRAFIVILATLAGLLFAVLTIIYVDIVSKSKSA